MVNNHIPPSFALSTAIEPETHVSRIIPDITSKGAPSTSYHADNSVIGLSTSNPEGIVQFMSLSTSLFHFTVTKTEECPASTNECTTGGFSEGGMWMAITGVCITLSAIVTSVCLFLGCVVLHHKRASRGSNDHRLGKLDTFFFSLSVFLFVILQIINRDSRHQKSSVSFVYVSFKTKENLIIIK